MVVAAIAIAAASALLRLIDTVRSGLAAVDASRSWTEAADAIAGLVTSVFRQSPDRAAVLAVLGSLPGDRHRVLAVGAEMADGQRVGEPLAVDEREAVADEPPDEQLHRHGLPGAHQRAIEHRLRDIRRFDSQEALQRQLTLDLEQTRQWS